MLKTVLLGYGFCIPSNPHDSVSVKLPSDEGLYMITRNNPLPSTLFSKFCTGREGRTSICRGYLSYLRALRQKLLAIGFDELVCDRPGGRAATIYRESQQEVLLRTFKYVTGLLRELSAGAEISAMSVLRRREGKKRRKEEDVDSEMVEWLVGVISGVKDEHSKDTSNYIIRLAEYYRNIPDEDENEEMERECRHIRKRLKRVGLEVKIEDVKTAMRIWDGESVEIRHFQDVLVLCEGSFTQGDSNILLETLAGEVVDIVMFIDEIPSAWRR